MLCWRTLRKECTQWVVTVAPPPLGFFYKPVWPLKHNCFRYMYHVNDGCVEGFPNILSSVDVHQILLVISILIHRDLFNVNTLWLSLTSLSWSKRRREKKISWIMPWWPECNVSVPSVDYSKKAGVGEKVAILDQCKKLS